MAAWPVAVGAIVAYCWVASVVAVVSRARELGEETPRHGPHTHLDTGAGKSRSGGLGLKGPVEHIKRLVKLDRVARTW